MSFEKLPIEQIKTHQTEYMNDDVFRGEIPACKEDYRIAICQDGKFAVTFDTSKSRRRK